MANVLTRNIFSCDSLGIISHKPITLKGINFYADAVDLAFQLLWWDESSTTLNSAGVTYTITTSTDNTVTASGGTPFPSTWLDGNVVKCLSTTGSDTGKYGLIKTAGNNTVFVTHLNPFTTEATKTGHWACYPTYNAFRGKMTKAADTEFSMWFPFPIPIELPNLALDSLGASSYVDLYVG